MGTQELIYANSIQDSNRIGVFSLLHSNLNEENSFYIRDKIMISEEEKQKNKKQWNQ